MTSRKQRTRRPTSAGNRSSGSRKRSTTRTGRVWWTISASHLEGSRQRAPRERGPLDIRRGRGDLVLLAAVGMLVALGILMVFDVTYFDGQERHGDAFRFFRRHVIGVSLGIVALFACAHLHLTTYRRIAFPFAALAIVGITLVLSPLGMASGGAQRWIPVMGMSVQPSEIAKLALVLYLAWWLAQHRDRVAEFKFGTLPPVVLIVTAAALLLMEPDFGTAVLLAIVLTLMLFVAGVPFRHIGLLLAAAIPSAVALVLVSPYRWARLLSFLDPWSDPRDAGFQLVQSFITFGSGGLTGVGLGESRQKMFYLPAAHTDFIFSVIGEELGLLGAIVVLALFFVLAFRGIRIAVRHPDPFGRLLAFGLTALLALQALVNTAVVLGLLPTKGLALPFVSYGGTAMVVALASTGILYGLSRETG